MEIISKCEQLITFLHVIVYAHGTSAPQTTVGSDDPSLFPGHLEPLGSRQVKKQIETLTSYPSPTDFFEKYIKPGRPFLLKDGAKDQPAFKLWNDDYMKSFPESETELVEVEPNLKEVREAKGYSIPLKEFIETYHEHEIYMVNRVPSFLQKDVEMPSPLKCNTTRDLMLDHVVWMSSGGTKSVLHNDDLDNINCLFRGSKHLLMINPDKYKGKVPIDHPNGGYSSLDVDRVNFTKYPSLREVEYIECQMDEGDCLFIPWRWYHQVNSVANQNRQNIAVNIWFQHQPDHKPDKCDVGEDKTTLENFHFKGVDSLAGNEEGEMEYPLLSLYEYTLSKTKFNRANLNTFQSILKRIPGIFLEKPITDIDVGDGFKDSAQQMFNKLNVNGDKYISKEDFDEIFQKNEIADSLESWLDNEMVKMKSELETLLDDTKKKDEL